MAVYVWSLYVPYVWAYAGHMAIAEVVSRFIHTPRTEAVQKDKVSVMTPWQILKSNDPEYKMEARAIRSSVIPLFFVGGTNFVPMSEVGNGNLICKSKEGDEKTNGQPAIWLNQEKWQDVLGEFMKFTKEFDSSLKWLVLSHEFDKNFESIMVTPVRIDSGGYHRGALTYGLNLDGQLFLGNEYESYDLGYLEPDRIHKAKIDALLCCFYEWNANL